MEIRHDMSPEEAEKSFSLRVDNLPEADREKYEKLLFKYKRDQAKPSRGKPVVSVPLEVREEILLSAKVSRTYEAAVKAFDMKLAFKKATSSSGRPPLGGAPDD